MVEHATTRERQAMDIAGIGLFQLAGKRLNYLAQRQQVIAQNVVNANTPAYKAKDLEPFERVMAGMHPVTPVRTDPMHLAAAGLAGGDGAAARVRSRGDSWETVPDRNSVSLEQEMIRSADTREAYGMVAGIYQKHAGLLRLAYAGHGG
jgi:flagellar basal-body rod protein FlgB